MAIKHMTTPQRSFDHPVVPPRYKMVLLTWAAAFPVLTVLNLLFGPQLAALPLPARTLLVTGLLITLLTYVIMPRLTRWCADWLLCPSASGGQYTR